MRSLVARTLALLATLALAACGGGEAAGSRTVTWYVFNEPSGAYRQAAENCSRGKGPTGSPWWHCPPTPTSSAS